MEHTADIEFKAYGKSLEEVFENSGLAFYNSIVDLSEINEKEEIKIEVEGNDLINLLYNFLEELLYNFDVNGFLGKCIKVKISKNEKYHLSATVKGERFNPEKHHYKTEIKAVTYHQMRIQKENEKYISHVILDI